jgi:hypothetical protein
VLPDGQSPFVRHWLTQPPSVQKLPALQSRSSRQAVAGTLLLAFHFEPLLHAAAKSPAVITIERLMASYLPKKGKGCLFNRRATIQALSLLENPRT